MRVLHAIHDFLPRHRAGAEIYAAALCRELGRRHHVTIVAADYDPACPHGELRWRLHDGLSVVEVVNNWRGAFTDSYRSPLITRRLEQLLDVVRPEILHVHSLLNLSLDLPALARRHGIEVVGTLHDYTLVCPSGGQRLHRAEAHVCHDIEPERCARCFSQSVFHAKLAAGAVSSTAATRRAAAALRTHAPRLATLASRAAGAAAVPIRPTDITARLDAARAAIDAFSMLVSPSESMAEEYRRLGVPPDRLRVSDYGFATQPRVTRLAQPGQPLRAAYMGTLVWHKGVHVILDALRHLPHDAIEVTIFGEPRVSPDYVSALQRQAAGLAVRFAGAFDDGQRAALLACVDVLIVPSLWLENSPLVIHEAFMAAVPVIASRIGGITGLVDDGVNGLLVEPGSAAALAAALRKVCADPALLQRLSANAPAVKTIAQDASEWEARYVEVLGKRQAPAD